MSNSQNAQARMTNDQVLHYALTIVLTKRGAWGQLGAGGAAGEGDGLRDQPGDRKEHNVPDREADKDVDHDVGRTPPVIEYLEAKDCQRCQNGSPPLGYPGRWPFASFAFFFGHSDLLSND